MKRHSPSRTLLYLDSCQSTQDELWARWDQLAEESPEVIYTLDQRAGRGRRGRSWSAPPGCCLCLSWRVPVAQLSAEGLWALPFVGGLALAKLTRSLGAPCSLKWPNDLLWQGRKLAGVLCEARVAAWGSGDSASVPRVVMGVGLNLSPSPSALEGSVSLSERLGGGLPEPAQLAALLTQELKESFSALLQEGSASVIEAWRRDALPIGTPLKVGARVGALRGVSDRGSLLLDTPEGVVSIDSGEAELITTMQGVSET